MDAKVPTEEASRRPRRRALALALALPLLAATIGCGNKGIQPGGAGALVQVENASLPVMGKTRVLVNMVNPNGHQITYTYAARRGWVVGSNNTAIYTAPFTGGPDTITVTATDITDGVEIGSSQAQVFVNGQAMTYTDTGGQAEVRNDTNLNIKIFSLQGQGQDAAIPNVIGRRPTISPDGRYVAYVYYPGDGTSQIMVVDSRGQPRNLTNSRSFNIDPSWAPDGKSIVFASDRIFSGNNQITDGHGERYNLYVLSVEGGIGVRPLTHTAGNSRQPSWSPDGKKVVFSSDLQNNHASNTNNLWLVDVQTGTQTQLTNEGTVDTGAFNPQWSQDGRRLAYSRKYRSRQIINQVPLQKIWMIDMDTQSGTGPGQILTREDDPKAVEDYPTWSPRNSAERVAYARVVGAAASEIVAVDANPTARGTLTQPQQLVSNGAEPNWSKSKEGY